MAASFEIVEVPPGAWAECIDEVVAVRTSAYEEWNGPKTKEQRRAEAGIWMAKWSTRRKPKLFVAMGLGRIVGYASADERKPGEFYISHVGVHPQWRRKGVGRDLIRTCEDAARQLGCCALATGTYKRFGGMLDLLLKEGFHIQPVKSAEVTGERRIALRKEL